MTERGESELGEIPASSPEVIQATQTREIEIPPAELQAMEGEIARKAEEKPKEYRNRVAAIAAKLEIDPGDYTPKKLEAALKQALNYKRTASATEILAETPSKNQEVMQTSAANVRIKTRPFENEVSAALEELKAEGSEKQDIESHIEKKTKPRGAAYGKQMTDLHNILKGNRSSAAEKINAGTLLAENYRRQMDYAQGGRDYDRYREKLYQVENALALVLGRRTNSKRTSDMTRNFAEATLAKVPKYEDLNASTGGEGNEKFEKISRELLNKFAVHGIITHEKDTGKIKIARRTDLDGKVAMGLFKQAGFDTTNLEYVAAGDSRKGKINVDTGYQDGLAIEDGGRTVYLDHHALKSGSENSAANEVYEVLTKTRMMERRPALKKLVDFVTQYDNMSFPPEEYGPKSARTLIGLHKQLGFETLAYLIRKRKEPLKPFTDRELAEVVVKNPYVNAGKEKVPAVTLLDVSRRRQQAAEQAQQELVKMEQEGFTVDSKDYGKIVVDIGGRLKTGADAVKASGGGMLIMWMPENNSFFLTSLKGHLKHSFGQGKQIRDTMWIKPRTDEAPLSIKLEDVLKEVTGGEFNPTGKLKEYVTPKFTTDIGRPVLRRPGGEKVNTESKPEAGGEKDKETQLRKTAEALIDKRLNAQMDGFGMTEEEQEAQRNTPFFKRQRNQAINGLLEKIKAKL